MLHRLLGVAARAALCSSKLGIANTCKLYAPKSKGKISLRLADGKDFFIRPRQSDRDVFLSVFRDRQYPAFAHSQIETFLDAGANIGCASRWWLQFHPAATFVAIEPEDSNFSMLSANLAPYAANTTLVRGGLWTSKTTLGLNLSTGNLSSVRLSESGPSLIETFTIDELAELTPKKAFDIIKLDIEGAEREVFAAHATHRWLDSALAVIVEIHEDYAPGVAKEMAKAFSAHDYALFLSGENLVWIRASHVPHLRRDI